MRRLLLVIVFFLPSVVFSQTPTISPLNPVLTPGGATQTFTVTSNPGTGGTFTCANTSNGGACLGSITTGGVYTPPASLAANNAIGGYQLLPYDHVFNTRIDSLPVDTAGATFTITAISRTSGVTTVTHNTSSSIGLNNTVTISGVADSSFNGTFSALAFCGNNCVKYNNAGSDGSSSGGTVFLPRSSGAGTAPISLQPSQPINYQDGSTPTENMTFQNSPGNNGSFPSPIFPSVGIQNGWFDAISNANNDHHEVGITTTTGVLNEFYQHYAQAPLPSCVVNASNSVTCAMTPTNTSPGFARAAMFGANIRVGSFTGSDTYLNGVFALTGATATSITFNITHAAATTSTTGQVTINAGSSTCAVAGTCNSQGGLSYTNSAYTLPSVTTNAASTEIAPVLLKANELVNACENGGSITHALHITLANGFIANAAVWPAFDIGGGGGGIEPYGERFRLKAAFTISGYSPCAQKVLTALQQYGVILDDGGIGWNVNIEYGDFPPTESAALKEITNSSIDASNWEAVDESSLMTVGGSSSGATTSGEVVTYTASTGSVSTNVALMGTAVNVPQNQYYIMAGTPAQQLVSYSSAGGVTWSILNASGTIQFVGSTQGSTTSSATSIATSAIKSSTGDFVFISAGHVVGTSAPLSISDTCGNTYTHASSLDFNPSATSVVTTWYSIGITGCSSNVFTANWGSSVNSPNIVAREYNPNGATITVDITPSPTTSSAAGQTSFTSPAFTTTGTNEVIIANMGVGSSASFTLGTIAGQSATNFQQTGATFGIIGTEDLIVASIETGVTASMNFNSNSNTGMSIIAFKGSGGSSFKGSITSGGLYTPPTSATSMIVAPMIATSAANASVASRIIVYILPANDFRLIQGTSNYTDSNGAIWNSGGAFGIGVSNGPSWQGCCQNDSLVTGTDHQLFWNHYASSQTNNDMNMFYHVPNGVYLITFNNGTIDAAGNDVRNFYTQRGLVTTVDSTVAAGGQHLQWTLPMTATVTNNVLSIINAGIGRQANNSGDVSSISISQQSPVIPFAPPPPGVLIQ